MWKELEKYLDTKNYKELQGFLDSEYQSKNIFPKRENIFRCFSFFPINKLKVIIIGQDPYHEINQANGLAFSVYKGVKLPPSLVNIYKEIDNEFNANTIKDGELDYLANQGVLLLNKYLSVEEGKPLSHKNKLYDILFENIITGIENLCDFPIVYMLWGNESKKISKYITNKKHLIITANHPSPLSANRGGWFNTNIFIKCNEYLKENNIEIINWVKK